MKAILWIVSFLTAASAYGAPCAFPSAPKILVAKGKAGQPGSQLIQVWETPNLPVFRSPRLPRSLSLRQFRRTVARSVADLSAETLLRKALRFAPAGSPERRNLQLSLATAGWSIRPLNCLEALLLSRQTDRDDMVSSPTEFAAFVLRSKTSGALKIYYYTVDKPGIGGLGEILEYVRKDMQANPDWFFWKQLHNHNFFLDQPDISGVPSPSGPDVQAFRNMGREMGLQEALVTNGFDTLRLSRRDFSRYRAAK